MKFLEAYKDHSGFHYLVELRGPSGEIHRKAFNYGPAPGVIYVDLAVSSDETMTGPKSIPIPETEDDYRKRIEEEIETVSKLLEKTWQVDPKTGAITADVKTDLLKKK